MFDSLKLTTNNKLIAECSKLIEEHNKLSYKKVSLASPSISFDYIKPKYFKQKSSMSSDIIQFFEMFVAQMVVTSELKTIIESIAYTNEDLSIHIDRSPDSISQIFSSLTETRIKLTNTHGQIIQNIDECVKAFDSYFASQLNPDIDISEVIEVIYICMTQHGLAERINSKSRDRPFIYVGAKLIETLYKTNLLSQNHIQSISEYNDKLKQTVLGADSKIQSNAIINRLQTFGLVPDEGPNQSLHDVINTLFGLNMKLFPSIKDAMDPLSKTLKLVTADTGVATGLIIILSPNEDTYFDMTNLYSVSRANGDSGIDEHMVNTFDLIRHGNSASIKQSEMITIGIDLDKTKMAYILWSNDLKTFKMKNNPIGGAIIRKILRNTPSATIESYNNTIEELIVNNRVEDAISFNRVKYMSFSDAVTEESFLSKFQTKLVSAVMNSIGKLEGWKMRDAIVHDLFTDDMLDAIDAAKVDLGIHPQLFSAHCNIIYASMANKIVNSLKKELLQQTKLNKVMVGEIVKLVVETNDNIYSRVIASYYLHMA